MFIIASNGRTGQDRVFRTKVYARVKCKTLTSLSSRLRDRETAMFVITVHCHVERAYRLNRERKQNFMPEVKHKISASLSSQYATLRNRHIQCHASVSHQTDVQAKPCISNKTSSQVSMQNLGQPLEQNTCPGFWIFYFNLTPAYSTSWLSLVRSPNSRMWANVVQPTGAFGSKNKASSHQREAKPSPPPCSRPLNGLAHA